MSEKVIYLNQSKQISPEPGIREDQSPFKSQRPTALVDFFSHPKSKNHNQNFSNGWPIRELPENYIVACDGNLNKAWVLHWLVFWAGKGRCWGAHTGWFYKSFDELSKETYIEARTLYRIIRWLKAQGFLETKVKMVFGVRTAHYKIDFTKLRAFMKDKIENGY
jgi:hypothetical protein